MDKLNQRNVKSNAALKVKLEKINNNILIIDPKTKIMNDVNNIKRFNTITVHDHLYKIG